MPPRRELLAREPGVNAGIYALATVSQSLDTVLALHRRIRLDGVIALASPRDDVAGWCDVRAVANPVGLQTLTVRSYDLTDPADATLLGALDIDILLSLGWQRLLPGWLLSRCRRGAIGVHGSPWGISRGRGRSPQTWTLILGEPRFEVSLFVLGPGIDDGPVLASIAFEVNDRDDISTLFKKTSSAAVEMIIEVLHRGDFSGRPQAGRDARYLPQRRPQDGGIDWHLSTQEIDRFVRALTRPYPGAFTSLSGSKVTVWRARPYGPAEGRRPGEVVHSFLDGAFEVHTGDGTLLVEDASGSSNLSEGVVLGSVDARDQYTRIVALHEARHPGQPLAPEILRLVGRS
jgi:methionyl-tRNA formyltransferase